MTEEGFVLTGALNTDQTGESPSYKTAKQSVTIKADIPDDVASDIVNVRAITSLDGTTEQFATVDIKITCENASGVLSTYQATDIRINANFERNVVTLARDIPMFGADKQGNTLKVVVSRNPATSGSTDPYFNSIVFHSLDVQYDRSSIKGKSQSSNFGGASRTRRTF